MSEERLGWVGDPVATKVADPSRFVSTRHDGEHVGLTVSARPVFKWASVVSHRAGPPCLHFVGLSMFYPPNYKIWDKIPPNLVFGTIKPLT